MVCNLRAQIWQNINSWRILHSQLMFTSGYEVWGSPQRSVDRNFDREDLLRHMNAWLNFRKMLILLFILFHLLVSTDILHMYLMRWRFQYFWMAIYMNNVSQMRPSFVSNKPLRMRTVSETSFLKVAVIRLSFQKKTVHLFQWVCRVSALSSQRHKLAKPGSSW
jgi:hypothetical protein